MGVDALLIDMRYDRPDTGPGNAARGYAAVLTSLGASWGWSEDADGYRELVERLRPRLVIAGLWRGQDWLLQLAADYPGVTFVGRPSCSWTMLHQYGQTPDWCAWLCAVQQCEHCWAASGSEMLVRGLVRLGVARAVWLPNVEAVDSGQWIVDSGAEPAATEPLRIGVAGRVDWVKNWSCAALACLIASRQRPVEVHAWFDPETWEHGLEQDVWQQLGARLVYHGWADGSAELRRQIVAAGVQVGLAPSYSETYCQVAADFAACGCALVGTPAIEWLSRPVRHAENPRALAAALLAGGETVDWAGICASRRAAATQQMVGWLG